MLRGFDPGRSVTTSGGAVGADPLARRESGEDAALACEVRGGYGDEPPREKVGIIRPAQVSCQSGVEILKRDAAVAELGERQPERRTAGARTEPDADHRLIRARRREPVPAVRSGNDRADRRPPDDVDAPVRNDPDRRVGSPSQPQTGDRVTQVWRRKELSIHVRFVQDATVRHCLDARTASTEGA